MDRVVGAHGDSAAICEEGGIRDASRSVGHLDQGIDAGATGVGPGAVDRGLVTTSDEVHVPARAHRHGGGIMWTIGVGEVPGHPASAAAVQTHRGQHLDVVPTTCGVADVADVEMLVVPGQSLDVGGRSLPVQLRAKLAVIAH